VSSQSPLAVVSRLVLAVLVYLTVLALLAGALYLAGLLLVSSPGWAYSMLGLAVAEGGAFVSVITLWRYVEHRDPVTLGFRRERARQQWLRGALVGTL